VKRPEILLRLFGEDRHRPSPCLLDDLPGRPQGRKELFRLHLEAHTAQPGMDRRWRASGRVGHETHGVAPLQRRDRLDRSRHRLLSHIKHAADIEKDSFHVFHTTILLSPLGYPESK